MSALQDTYIREEWRDISDADNPPTGCPSCGSSDFSRNSYRFRDLQELGSLKIARRVRYESVVWKCKKCQSTFILHNPKVPSRTPYMSEVVDYAKYRVLTKGDSATRVSDDLKHLHNVYVSEDAILSWITPKSNGRNDSPENPANSGTEFVEFSHKAMYEDFSGVLGVDATFRAVKAKKNDPQKDGNEPLSLHLTRQQDGRLAAHWQQGKLKKRSKNSSKKSK